MSNQKILKAARRRARKDRIAAGLSYFGVRVTRRDVMAHRYLAVKGLPYSQTIANVPLKGDAS